MAGGLVLGSNADRLKAVVKFGYMLETPSIRRYRLV